MGVEMYFYECMCLHSFLKRVDELTTLSFPANYVIEALAMNVQIYGDLPPIKMSGPMLYQWPICNNGLYCMLNLSYKDGEVRVYKFQLYRQNSDGQIFDCGFQIFTPSVRLPFQYIHS